MDERNLIIVAGAVGALAGTLITALTNLILAAFNRRSEERQQLYELMLKAAITKYNEDGKNAAVIAAQQNIRVIVPPLETYLLRNFLLMNALGNRAYSVEQLKRRLKNSNADYQELVKSFDIKNPDGTKYEPR